MGLRPTTIKGNRLRDASYFNKVLRFNPIAYWPLWETSGAAARDISSGLTTGLDGTYTGVTLGQTGIGDGFTSPLFDGINDYTNTYSVGLNVAFNGSEGTALIWLRVFNAAVWADGIERRAFQIQTATGSYILLRKLGGINAFDYRYVAGGVAEQRQVAVSTTGWFCVALTWSKTADEVRAYLDGVQQGATMTVLGVWGGALGNTVTLIGAANTVPQLLWYGYAAHAVLFDSALSPTNILTLSTLDY